MNISKGSLTNSTHYQRSTKLTYYLSSAKNPPDKLIFNDKEYIIKPGLQITIPKVTVYEIQSKDLHSYRVYKKTLDLQETIKSSLEFPNNILTGYIIIIIFIGIYHWKTTMSSIGHIFFSQIAFEVLLSAKIEVDISALDVGQSITVEWKGKPVFIRKRTQEEIDQEKEVDIKNLKDPVKDEHRYLKDPKLIVLVGICTHLGCVPLGGKEG
jgi:hypothetical protein